MINPKVTIITVAFNAADYIEKTLLSVINQTYSNIEYIIIDGGSTDGTVDIIKKYSNKISYWISEPDKGIYDAMNKGINKATGDWINFMNAGDTFYSCESISTICNFLEKTTAEIIYGDANFIYDWGTKIYQALPLNLIIKHMIFSHQSSFTKTQLLKTQKFSTKYKIAGDYDFFYHQFLANKKFLHIPICVANYDAIQGISARQHFLAMKENAYINGNIKKTIWKISYYKDITLCNISNIIKKILPNNITLLIKRSVW